MKAFGIFIAFIAIMLIGFFAIGFASSVQAPTDPAALQQYNNLSKTVTIASTGINATMLLLIFGMVIASVLFLVAMVKRR